MSSELALTVAQWMLENGADEDRKPVGHVADSLRTGAGSSKNQLI